MIRHSCFAMVDTSQSAPTAGLTSKTRRSTSLPMRESGSSKGRPGTMSPFAVRRSRRSSLCRMDSEDCSPGARSRKKTLGSVLRRSDLRLVRCAEESYKAGDGSTSVGREGFSQFSQTPKFHRRAEKRGVSKVPPRHVFI